MGVDTDNMLACIEAGAAGEYIEEQLRPKGLCFGHEPDSYEFRYLQSFSLIFPPIFFILGLIFGNHIFLFSFYVTYLSNDCALRISSSSFSDWFFLRFKTF
jgi:FAD/FMN-containing dehydrogenase